MDANKGTIVKQSRNDIEGCRSEKVLVQPNMRVFLQYSVMFRAVSAHDPAFKPVICFLSIHNGLVQHQVHTAQQVPIQHPKQHDKVFMWYYF